MKRNLIKLMCFMSLVGCITGCGNSVENNSNPLIKICDNLERDIESYKNNEIKWDDFYSKVKQYNEECNDKDSTLCITLSSISIMNPQGKELRQAYVTELNVDCTKERDKN